MNYLESFKDSKDHTNRKKKLHSTFFNDKNMFRKSVQSTRQLALKVNSLFLAQALRGEIHNILESIKRPSV